MRVSAASAGRVIGEATPDTSHVGDSRRVRKSSVGSSKVNVRRGGARSAPRPSGRVVGEADGPRLRAGRQAAGLSRPQVAAA